MKRMLRIFCALLALLLVLPMLVSCGATRPVRASARANRVVAKAGDVKILYEELYYLTMNYIKELKLTYGEDALQSEAVRAELENLVWGNLLTGETALISLGYKNGLNVYKGTIAENVSADIAAVITEEYQGDRAAYIASLEAQYMTEHYARKSLGLSYLATEMQILCVQGLNVSDDTVRADAKNGNFVCFRRVLVQNDKDDAAARATAERIRAELAAITDITARCEAMNDAIGSADNKDFGDLLGYGYYYPRGYLSAEYEAAVFSLDMYGIGEVLKTDEGYAVVMRMPVDENYVEENLYDLKGLYGKLEYNRQVTAEYEALELVKTRLGASLDLTALAPIDVDGGSTTITVICLAGALVLGLSAVLGIVYRARRKKRIK